MEAEAWGSVDQPISIVNVRQLLAEERRHSKPQEGMRAGEELIRRQLQNAGLDCSEFVFSLSEHTRLSASLK